MVKWIPPWARIPVPVVRIAGVLGAVPWRRGGISLLSLERHLQAAFSLRRAPAVALVVDSPGGSAVQASLLAGRIRRLAEERGRRVLAFVEDVAASGGYWVACAADEIIVDPNSILGSIGVISAGFGFHGALSRFGIERRVHARGPYKDFLDPFEPERPEHVAVLEEIQEEIHARFLDWVRRRRGERLRLDDDRLGSGRVWTGAMAVELGLADGIGELRDILRARFGERVRPRLLNPPRAPWLRGLAVAGGGAIADRMLEKFEERLLLDRFGL